MHAGRPNCPDGARCAGDDIGGARDACPDERFGEQVAVDGLDLAIASGEISIARVLLSLLALVALLVIAGAWIMSGVRRYRVVA